MCGRFTLRDPVKAYEVYLRRKALGLPPPRFNVGPGEKIPVVRSGEGGEREIEELLWAFFPKFAKSGTQAAPIINARAETVASRPAFREAFRKRRCLVPADGFYEWRTREGRKEPHFFRFRGDRPFALAALWEEGTRENGKPARGFCLLTTDANSLLARIHDRMPVILDEDGASRWLSASPERAAEELAPLMRPFAPEEMEDLRVNSWVNKTGNEGPRCLEPPGNDEPEQLSLL